MDLGSLLFIFALLLLVGWFVARPFFSLQHIFGTDACAEEHELSSLLAEHERLLNTLQELDFDYMLGKIPEDDYPLQRTALLQHGRDILRRIDALKQFAPDVKLETSEGGLEANGASSHESMQPQDAFVADGAILDANDDIERLIAARRCERQGQSAGFCPKCGKPVQKADRFCTKCGVALV